MPDALLGATGYVGSTLRSQRRFDACFRSTDVADAARSAYGLVVCAAAPAQKWLANREPAADRSGIDRLRAVLEQVRCRHFVLISTVDVYARPIGVDESTAAPFEGLAPYGLHRRELELFVAERFARSTIVRLPGLVGPGLRKNAVHDLHHDHQVERIDPRGLFQFYPMVNLWSDLARVLHAELGLVHLTAEPVAIGDIAREVFGRELVVPHDAPDQAARYDLRSRHSSELGGRPEYLYDRREVLTAIRAYAQSEPRKGDA